MTQAAVRSRLSQDERRRQLIGIGLRMLVEKPIQDLSLDAVATEAGISRSLLFHYFPTKSAYYDAVLGAALRRVLRNTSPDDDAEPELAVRQFVERFYAQIERRREFYVALVFGTGAVALGGDSVDSLRMAVARRVTTLLDLPDGAIPVAHAWAAYVEDRALQWTALSSAEQRPLADELDDVTGSLSALLRHEGVSR